MEIRSVSEGVSKQMTTRCHPISNRNRNVLIATISERVRTGGPKERVGTQITVACDQISAWKSTL